MRNNIEKRNEESVENTSEVSEQVQADDSTRETSETPEDYEDCEVKETGEAAEEGDKSVEETEDFDDCSLEDGKETEETEKDSSDEINEFDEDDSEKDQEKDQEKDTEKGVEKDPEKTAEKDQEKDTEKTAEKDQEKDAEKTGETPEEKAEKVAEKPEEKAEKKAEKTEEKPEVKAEETEEKPEETPEAEEEKPESKAEKVEEKKETEEEKAEKAPEAEAEKVEDVPEAKEEKPEKEAEKAEEKPEETPEAEETTEEKLEDETEQVEEKTETDAEKVEEKPEAEAEKVEETPEAEAEKVEETPEAEAEEVEETPEAEAEKVEETPETGEEKPEETSEEVKEAPEEKPEEKPEEVKETPEEKPEEKPEEVEETPEEKPEETDETGEEKPEEMDEAKAEEYEAEIRGMTADEYREYKEMMEREGLSASEFASYRQKSELRTLTEARDGNKEALEKFREEEEQLKKESSEKFEATLKEQRGTDSYKQALKDYNETNMKREELASRVKEAETVQQNLDRRTAELRHAQLEAGEAAAAESRETLEKSQKLQEQFEESYYSRKPDAGELKELEAGNSKVISELSKERDSVKLAMEAKMSQIRDYVSGKNLGRYETEHDPRYQAMIQEYRELEKTHHQLDYHVVKLDENNLSSSEITGTQYESVRFRTGTLVREVADGTDEPGKTDYFVDETRAKEVLSPFKADQWEHMELRDQKAAIEQLAAYNADILGIEDPPEIVYYKDDDPDDFGGYSDSHHIIYINEKNLGDAAETADTISHEYRHCYQRMRAEKLENERDLAFREGLDNYRAPENSYQGYLAYKNQLVEKDAREYADAVRARLAEMEAEEKGDAPEKTRADSIGRGTERFSETDRKDLPDDVETKRVREVRDVHEKFTVDEIDEIKAAVDPHYKNGAEIGKHIREFNGYKEHNDTGEGHIGKVLEKSEKAADILEADFASESYGGLYSSEIDRKTLSMMALYHDTGMDGNIRAEEFTAEKEKFLNEPGRREDYVRDQLLKNPEMTEAEAEEKYKDEAYESQFRKEHSVQSAIHVLRDREKVESYGVSADEVALGCLAHSKSNSGVLNIADEGDWNEAVNRLQNAVAEFNRNHPEEQITFSDAFLRKTDGSFDADQLAKMRSEALCLRIGDAEGHDSRSRISQNGSEISFSIDEWAEVKEALPPALEKKILSGDCTDFKEEAELGNVVIGGVELNDSNDEKGFGRMFALGEGNFRSMDLVMENGVPTQKIVLENGDAYPLCTEFCIRERLLEYNTAKIEPNIERPAGMSDAAFKKYKAEQGDAMQKIDFVAEIDLGEADERTIRSYRKFAARIQNQYDMKVTLKYQSREGGK